MKILQAFSKTVEKIRAGAADIGAELEKVRLDRLALISELESVRQARVTDDVIRARVEEVVDSSARYAEGRFLVFTYGEPKLDDRYKPDLDNAIQKSPVGMLALLGFRDTMVSALVAISKKDDREAITEADRATRIAKLTADLRKVEVAEEALVRSLEDAGFAVQRRGDADPEILLTDNLNDLA